MSRNLGRVDCARCGGTVRLVEPPRPITEQDAGAYFTEHRGRWVAHAECHTCAAKYLAWLTGQVLERADARLHYDLSYRSTFDDEPGPDDLPPWTPTEPHPFEEVAAEVERRARALNRLRRLPLEGIVVHVLDEAVWQAVGGCYLAADREAAEAIASRLRDAVVPAAVAALATERTRLEAEVRGDPLPPVPPCRPAAP